VQATKSCLNLLSYGVHDSNFIRLLNSTLPSHLNFGDFDVAVVDSHLSAGGQELQPSEV
jgi:hypothetical protein